MRSPEVFALISRSVAVGYGRWDAVWLLHLAAAPRWRPEGHDFISNPMLQRVKSVSHLAKWLDRLDDRRLRPSRHDAEKIRRRHSSPYDIGGRSRRKQPRFYENEAGQAAAAEYARKLNIDAQALIDTALGEVLFDARHLALTRAKAADTGEPLDAVAAWDREAVALVMQMRSAEQVGRALTRATFILAFATLALVAATVALVFATFAH